MKKKFTIVLFVFLLCIGTSFSVFASQGVFSDEHDRLTDWADLLTDSEESELSAMLDEISQRQKMDVAIATVNNLDGYSTATEYADALYEFFNYGYSEEKNGILLLISMENRDWAISTCGLGKTYFTNAGIDYIRKQIGSDLSDGNYSEAFLTFAKLCDQFITQATKDIPYDTGNLPREPLSVIWIPISMIIGVGLAWILVSRMKGKLKTVHSQTEANRYIKKDSLLITESNDLFLYRTVTRTKKTKNSNSGSSVHTSSSGTEHGGSSGKF